MCPATDSDDHTSLHTARTPHSDEPATAAVYTHAVGQLSLASLLGVSSHRQWVYTHAVGQLSLASLMGVSSHRQWVYTHAVGQLSFASLMGVSSHGQWVYTHAVGQLSLASLMGVSSHGQWVYTHSRPTQPCIPPGSVKPWTVVVKPLHTTATVG